jgi:hypothetical protein
LWLDYLREREAGRKHVAGLKLFVPPNRSAIVRERMAHMNRELASFELFEFNQKDDSVELIDSADRGNIATRLIHCPNQQGAHDRFAASISRIRAIAPSGDVVVTSPAEMSFRVRGPEYARARLGNSIHSSQELVFGVGPSETVLTDFEHLFREIVSRLLNSRQPRRAAPGDVLWRLAPERWLESLIIRNIAKPRSSARFAVGLLASSGVCCFRSGDDRRPAATTEGRLALSELKADEDLHLPLQGLDYWARVSWHHSRREFQKFVYFGANEPSEKPPLLYLVAPRSAFIPPQRGF